jgi:uncharacterized protein (TIGR02145 family)
MKETGLAHWKSPNEDATNSSGFTGLPGGYRDGNGAFDSIGSNGNWWSSTEPILHTPGTASCFTIYGSCKQTQLNKPFGFSVRCLRD